MNCYRTIEMDSVGIKEWFIIPITTDFVVKLNALFLLLCDSDSVHPPVPHCGQKRWQGFPRWWSIRVDLQPLPRPPARPSPGSSSIRVPVEVGRRTRTTEMRYAPGEDVLRKGFPTGPAGPSIVDYLFGKVISHLFQDSSDLSLS